MGNDSLTQQNHLLTGNDQHDGAGTNQSGEKQQTERGKKPVAELVHNLSQGTHTYG